MREDIKLGILKYFIKYLSNTLRKIKLRLNPTDTVLIGWFLQSIIRLIILTTVYL